MSPFILIVLAAFAPYPAFEGDLRPCGSAFHADEVVTSIADLPPDIQRDLIRLTEGKMADRGAPMRKYDFTSMTDEEVTVRFMQGIRVREKWFVSFEVTGMSPRTIGYAAKGDSVRRHRPFTYGGPPCAAISAAFAGVTAADVP